MSKAAAIPEEKAKEKKKESWFFLYLFPILVGVFVCFVLYKNAYIFASPDVRTEYHEVASVDREEAKKLLWRKVGFFVWQFSGRNNLAYFGLIAGLLIVGGAIRQVAKANFKEYEAIFEQYPEKEDLITHTPDDAHEGKKVYGCGLVMLQPSRLGLNEEWVIEEFFKDRESYELMWAGFWNLLIADYFVDKHVYSTDEIREVALKENKVVYDVKNINREVARIAHAMVRLAKLNGSVVGERQEKRALYMFAFCLFHFVSCFFGNVPTALISRYIKDRTLKRMLSLYISGCTLVPDENDPDEMEAAELLLVFQSFRKIYFDALEYLESKFSYIPAGYIYYRRFSRQGGF